MNSDTQGEPGLVSVTILRDAVHPNHFALLVSCLSEGDLAKHLEAAHTRMFRNDLQPLIGSPCATIVTTAMQ